MSEPIRWLHLTDLHVGMTNLDWLWPRMQDKFHEDLERIYEKAGPWDLVLFTGDLVQKGTEYSKLDGIFDEIWTWFKALRCNPKLLAVPGNHDLQWRDSGQAAVEGLGDWSKKQSVRDRFWKEKEGEYRQVVNAAFAAYDKWWKNTPRKPDGVVHGMLPGDFSCTFAKGDLRLGIVGLNSAFLQLTDRKKSYQGDLVVDPRQFNDACGGNGVKWAKGHHACLLMTHHPPEWLNKESRDHLNGEILESFCLHLCGHNHLTEVQQILTGGAKDAPLLWLGRSLFGLEKAGKGKLDRSHGYAAGELRVADGNVILQFMPRRRERQGNHWNLIPDSSVELPVNDERTREFPVELSMAVTVPPVRRQVKQKKLTNDLFDQGMNRKGPSSVKTPSKHIIPVLPPRPRWLIGRDRELRKVKEKLMQGGSVYIWGPPGVGKTALASQAAWSLTEHFQNHIVYDSSCNPSFDGILNLIARFFSENGIITMEPRDREREVNRLLNQYKPVLLYLDNVNDPSLAQSLERLSTSCSLLITSRAHAACECLHLERLPMLERSSSMELFEKAYDQPLADEERRHVDTICEKLGDMPLAIGVVAERANVSRLPISSLPALLPTIGSPVMNAINLSYCRLDGVTQRFFEMLGLFERRTFEQEAVTAMWGSGDAFDRLHQLIDLSLLTPVTGGRCTLHPLIQEFAAGKLKDRGDKDTFLKRMVGYYLQFAERHRAAFDELEAERETILAAMEECDRSANVEEYIRSAEAMLSKAPGHYAYGFLPQRGFWTEAMAITRRCIELRKEPDSIAKMYEHLGLFHYWKGEHDEAEELYKQALTLYDQCNDHYGQAVICHRLGFLRSDEGFYAECESLYRKSVAIAQENHLSKDILATGVHLVGVILYHRCRYAESRNWLTLALRMRCKLSSIEVSVTQRRLAATYRRMGLLNEAEKLLCESLIIDRQTGNERNLARSLRQLGMVHLDARRLDKARAHFEESYAIFRKLGNKRGIACVLTNLGSAELKQKQWRKAASLFGESLVMAKELRSRYGRAINLSWLGEIQYRRSHHRAALKCFRRALDHFESIGHLHVEDMCRLLNQSLWKLGLDRTCRLGPSLHFSGRCAKGAHAIFQDLWDNAKGPLGENKPDVDRHLLNLHGDRRRGISLIFRLSEQTVRLLSRVRDRLHDLAPEHYYYGDEDYHVTVATLIRADESFRLNDISQNDYINGLSRILSGCRPFRVCLCGVVGSKECILAQGSFADGTLDAIRWGIQSRASEFGLHVEDRHSKSSAHVTLVRFRSRSNVKRLAEEVERLKACDLGVCPVARLELVMNDWYMQKDKVTVLKSFDLQ